MKLKIYNRYSDCRLWYIPAVFLALLLLFSCGKNAGIPAYQSGLVKTDPDFSGYALCILINQTGADMFIGVDQVRQDGNKTVASISVPPRGRKNLLLENKNNEKYRLSLNGSDINKEQDIGVDTDWRIIISGRNAARWEKVENIDPEPYMFITPSRIRRKTPVEFGIYRLALLNERNFPASSFKASIKSPVTGDTVELKNFRPVQLPPRNDNYMESDPLPREFFLAKSGNYILNYTTSAGTKTVQLAVVDDNTPPEFKKDSLRQTYFKESEPLILNFTVKSDFDIDLSRSYISQMKRGGVVIPLKPNPGKPPVKQPAAAWNEYELEFEVDIPGELSGPPPEAGELEIIATITNNHTHRPNDPAGKITVAMPLSPSLRKTRAGERTFAVYDASQPGGRKLPISNANIWYYVNNKNPKAVTGYLPQFDFALFTNESGRYERADLNNEGKTKIPVQPDDSILFMLYDPKLNGYLQLERNIPHVENPQEAVQEVVFTGLNTIKTISINFTILPYLGPLISSSTKVSGCTLYIANARRMNARQLFAGSGAETFDVSSCVTINGDGTGGALTIPVELIPGISLFSQNINGLELQLVTQEGDNLIFRTARTNFGSLIALNNIELSREVGN
jgi:hypothetical protein